MLYTSIVAERIGLRRSFAVIMAISFALNFILALALLLQQPETRTIVVPPTLAAEREVWTFDEAGPGAPYLERWALSVLSHAASVTRRPSSLRPTASRRTTPPRSSIPTAPA